MALQDLVRAILSGDMLVARQWVTDAHRTGLRLESLEKPDLKEPLELAMAAGVTELLAEREHQSAPTWTEEIGGLSAPFFVGKIGSMPRTRAAALKDGPEPLRRRNVFAMANFLTVV